jgi:hypothetical protein
MKAIKFDGEIDEKSIKTLLSDIDKIDKNENIIIYFISSGGSHSDSLILSDYINRDYKRFEIYCPWDVSSAAFDFLIEVKCKIVLNKHSFARLHLFDNSLNYINLENNSSIDYFLKSNLEKNNRIWLNKLKIAGFTEEELNRIKQGYDVIIDSKRMIHVLKIMKRINK